MESLCTTGWPYCRPSFIRSFPRCIPFIGRGIHRSPTLLLVSYWHENCTGTRSNLVKGSPMPLPLLVFVSNDLLIRIRLGVASEPFLLTLLGAALFFTGCLIQRLGSQNRPQDQLEPTKRESTLVSTESRIAEPWHSPSATNWEQSFESRGAGSTASTARWITLNPVHISDEKSPALLGQ
jgi:hypothetical protein